MNKFKIFALTMFIGLIIQMAHAEELLVNPIYKNIFEDNRVWVYEMTFNPGAKWAIRKPSREYLIYILEGDELTLSHPDTPAEITTVKSGKVLRFPAEPHKDDSSKELTSESNATVAVEITNTLQPAWKDNRYQRAENNGASTVRVLVMEFKQDERSAESSKN